MSILTPLCLALLGGFQESAADLPRVLFLTHSAGYTHGVVRRPAHGTWEARLARVEFTANRTAPGR